MNHHEDTRKPRIGVLLVHGIGEQAPGAFLGEFRDGFGRLLGANRTTDIVRQDPGELSRRIYAAAIELDDRTLMLYEIHWANLITPEMARASFDPVQLFPLAWFPWFNKQWQLPGFDKYSQREVASWTYRLVPLTVLFFLGYIGLKAVPYHIMLAKDAVEIVSDRCDRRMMRMRGVRRSEQHSVLDEFEKRNERLQRRLWVEGKLARDCQRLEQAVMRTWFDKLLDAYTGDVTNFITSMARLPRLREDLVVARTFGGMPTDALTAILPQDLVQSVVDAPRRESDVMLLAERTRARFESAAWVAVMEDKCTEIQVLAHSLGTLVAYHAMNRAPPPPDTAAQTETCTATLTRFHTIGSPLEKIHFFWPRLVAPRGDKPSLSGQGPDGRAVPISVHSEFRWKNYYSVSDKVSGALTRFQGWNGIENQRLAGLGGVLSAHVAYKHNASFLCALAEQVGAVVVPQRSGSLRSALGWTWSAAQSLLLPIMFLTVCLLGVAILVGLGAWAAAVFTGLISLVGYALNWLFTGTGGSLWYGRFFFWSTLLFSVSMAAPITVFVWVWAKSAARASVARWWRIVRLR